MRRSLILAALAAAAMVAACDRETNGGVADTGSLASGAGPMSIAPSPDSARRLVLPVGERATEVAVWPNGPDVVFLTRTTDGRARVRAWHAGDAETRIVAELPAGYEARGIATHPARRIVYVTADRSDSAATSRIFAIEATGSGWRVTPLFQSPNRMGRIIVGPRPFFTSTPQYRLFVAMQLPAGAGAIRTVTDSGTLEYQVAGPTRSAPVYPGDPDAQPNNTVADVAVPLGFQPRGEPLLWQDGRGCVHSLEYDKNWTTDHQLTSVSCGTTAVFTPNGAAYLAWRPERAGIAIARDGSLAATTQAAEYTFTSAPAATPDGRGVIGVVLEGSSQALVYAPIALPLADVANAWQLVGDACDEQRFTQDGGMLRPRADTAQLYSVLETYNYAGYQVPFLVTTDVLWENFAAAYNGTFILLERREAVPAFWAMVQAADSELARTDSTSRWAKLFAALDAVHRGQSNDEASKMLGDAEVYSAALDSMYNFAELKPRGHYTTSEEMRRYFRAVHYLTEVGRLRDPAPLGNLSAPVQRLALKWIATYAPFIARSRAALVWHDDGQVPPLATYASHPWTHATTFPLSWGFDNEVLEATVYHAKWPPDQRIVAAEDSMVRRLHPSGVDVAATFGNALARQIVGPDLTKYSRLAPVMAAAAERQRRAPAASSLYDRWMDAVALEWADSTAFPSAPAGSRLWATKHLQTGLATWATLREATVLVSERAGAAEAGEGGFEEMVAETPRGYVEPSPQVFNAIAGLFTSLASEVEKSRGFANAQGHVPDDDEAPLRDGVLRRLNAAADEARAFARMAEKERRGQALSDSEYTAIQGIGGSVEHQFLIFKSLADSALALSTPDPLPKIADVAGDLRLGVLEVAVGEPLEWRQLVPYFGRRQIAIGSVYSYYEFISRRLYDNDAWRTDLSKQSRPAWVQPFVRGDESCAVRSSR